MGKKEEGKGEKIQEKSEIFRFHPYITCIVHIRPTLIFRKGYFRTRLMHYEFKKIEVTIASSERALVVPQAAIFKHISHFSQIE